MTNWHPDPKQLKRPAYLSLSEQFAEAIAEGALSAGERLPTHRQLAYDLGLSIQTVSRAYDELSRLGLVTGETGRGTFVARTGREPDLPYIPERTNQTIDVSMLKPVCEQMHIKRLRSALAEVALELPASDITSFRPNAVFTRHRAVAVEWLKHCGVETDAHNVLVTNGATPAMTIALMTAAKPKGMIVTEQLGHHTLMPLVSYLGMRLEGIAIDEQGIRPDALEKACRNLDVQALYLLPNGANPTNAIMGFERRSALVEIARRADIQIIENDSWGPLVEDHPAPFVTLAPERTHYFTSFTKIVVPGLRTGYLVVPERFVAAAANRHLVTNWMATPIIAELATRWVEDGTAMEFVHWQRDALRRRHRIVDEVLQGVDYRAHPESLHVWLPLPKGRKEDEFTALARVQGVAVAPGKSFAISHEHADPAIRICIGAPSERDLRAALITLAGLYHGDPEPALLAI
ncbi:PLP-dependent aminotransferase family protein [Pelagibius sp. Alg239-R121]|uniref:MocR-like ectoine utilization transcription factor EhuR n=1 Tax=Pelagibius sp. Alg239-R121 TaxID=2993448 RepID=UPI0024A77E32|nr:PLP-dependent aminotransferase family protein [Pelagibius sp. Alg239-R121]